VLHRTYILPALDYEDILYDNCSNADTNLLESAQASAVELILVCLRVTSHENILNDVGLTPLHLRRQFHILIVFRNTLFGPFFHLCSCSKIFQKSFRFFVTVSSQCTGTLM